VADIRLVPITSLDVITLDWLQTQSGLLDETNELITAVIVALCTDAQAAPTDVLPDPNSTDLRGWWGDYQADIIWGGWPIGSKLWLMTRSKIVDQNAREGATVARLQAYINQAMQPFVTAKLCSKFVTTVTQINAQRIDATVTIYRGPKTAIALQFQNIWQQLINPSLSASVNPSAPATPSSAPSQSNNLPGFP
jgi:phage gp46-like protein